MTTKSNGEQLFDIFRDAYRGRIFNDDGSFNNETTEELFINAIKELYTDTDAELDITFIGDLYNYSDEEVSNLLKENGYGANEIDNSLKIAHNLALFSKDEPAIEEKPAKPLKFVIQPGESEYRIKPEQKLRDRKSVV